MCLLRTEAPDSSRIPTAYSTHSTGYDDRRYGPSVNWNSAHTWLYDARAILRAQQEHGKAFDAAAAEQLDAAAFYLGTMRATSETSLSTATRIRTRPQPNTPTTRTGRRAGRTAPTTAPSSRSSYQTDSNYVVLTKQRREPKGLRLKGWGTSSRPQRWKPITTTRTRSTYYGVGAALNLAVNELGKSLHKFAVENSVSLEARYGRLGVRASRDQ